MRSLARFAYRRRWLVLVTWVIGFLVLAVLAKGAGSAYSNDFSFPDTDSTRALHLLQAVSPRQSGDRETVVFAAKGGGTFADPALRAAVTKTLADIQRVPHVTAVASPFGPRGAGQTSRDGRIVFAPVTFDLQPQDVGVPDAKRFVKTVTSHSDATVEVEVSGQLGQEARQQSGGLGTLIGIVAAAIVLLLVFGSVLAMLLPLITALLSLGTAISAQILLSHVMKMPQFSQELSLLIGLGVGIDYALFIVTRHRQGLLAGRDTEDAAVTSVDTSGRAVLFAGVTVCIALLGMFALGVTFFYGLAVASSITVLFTVVAALTLQPALLGFFGRRVLRRAQRRRLAAGELLVDDEGRGWKRWAGWIDRRPALPALVATGIVVALAIPFLSLRLGLSDEGNDPATATTRKAYDLLAKGFGPGFNGPLVLTAEAGTPAERAVLARLTTAVRAQPGVVAVTGPVVIPGAGGREVALLDAYPSSAPEDAATGSLLHRIRRDVIPTVTAGTGVAVYVGGDTAGGEDFSHVLAKKLPLFVGIVVLLSFLLLVGVFRSLLVPVTAAVMNLLSIGASFGVVTAVFQWGWLGSLIGADRPGPIDAFLPVLFFAILFGLSMDYEVFLVSRIHEEWTHRRDNREAVMHGLAATGRTITAAAAIMILVFAAFILGGERVIEEAGIGLASAILIDALIIRSVLVPALMRLFGSANWWLPGWLDRLLPRLSVEPADAADIPPQRETEPVRTS
jgi:putative drug exporter of the RND superfamily